MQNWALIFLYSSRIMSSVRIFRVIEHQVLISCNSNICLDQFNQSMNFHLRYVSKGNKEIPFLQPSIFSKCRREFRTLSNRWCFLVSKVPDFYPLNIFLKTLHYRCCGAFQAFIKPFAATQRSVKIKTYVNFYLNITF